MCFYGERESFRFEVARPDLVLQIPFLQHERLFTNLDLFRYFVNNLWNNVLKNLQKTIYFTKNTQNGCFYAWNFFAVIFGFHHFFFQFPANQKHFNFFFKLLTKYLKRSKIACKGFRAGQRVFEASILNDSCPPIKAGNLKSTLQYNKWYFWSMSWDFFRSANQSYGPGVPA